MNANREKEMFTLKVAEKRKET